MDNYRLTVVRRVEQVKIRIVQLREQYNRRYDVCTLLQNYRITDETDNYGMPKNVDYVNSIPEYIEKKIEWSEKNLLEVHWLHYVELLKEDLQGVAVVADRLPLEYSLDQPFV